MSELQEQLAALRRRMARVAAECDEKYGKPENPYSTGASHTFSTGFQVQEWFPGEEIITEYGKHFETETFYARHRRHGSAELSELAELPHALLEILTNAGGGAAPPQ